MFIIAKQNGSVCTLQQTQVQNSDHRWQDFQSIKTLINRQIKKNVLNVLARSDLKILGGGGVQGQDKGQWLMSIFAVIEYIWLVT